MKILAHEMPKQRRKPRREYQHTGLAWPSHHDDEIKHLITERSWTAPMVAKMLGISRQSLTSHIYVKGYKRPVDIVIRESRLNWRFIWMLRCIGNISFYRISKAAGTDIMTAKRICQRLATYSEEEREIIFNLRADYEKVMSDG